MWIEPDIRDQVTAYLCDMAKKTEIPITKLLATLELPKVKYYRWIKRSGSKSLHNSQIPKTHWLTPNEVDAVIAFAKDHYTTNDFFIRDGYRRLAYDMLDKNVVAASPSSVYRILKKEGLLNKWNVDKRSLKGKGFNQPDYPHKHWHTDIKYLNFNGTLLFLISVLDGYSRYVLHHEVRHNMAGYDVKLTIQKAKEKYPFAKPGIITDNGAQYISKEFKAFIKNIEVTHIKTSVAYPQSNGKLERFHRTISQECLRTKSPVTVDDFKQYIASYIKHYNTERLHSSLSYLTPEDFLLGRQKEKLVIREEKLQRAEVQRSLFWNNQRKVV
ncbi:MAG: transposase [Ignavibacteriales bacterium]|nr:transposase [Ignavibacteriales bacterium]